MEKTWEQLTYSSWVRADKPVYIFVSVVNPSWKVNILRFLIKFLRIGCEILSIGLIDNASIKRN